jgi:cell division protein FtsW (lipid II flippase)
MLGVLCLPFFWTQIHDYQRLRLVGMVLQSEQLRGYFKDHLDKWDWFRPPAAKQEDLHKKQADWRNELTRWETHAGFHLVHGKAAIGSGGAFGMGWADGPFIENEFLLPERENDFVFAMVAHQWGFFGCLVVLTCYVVLVVFGLDVATSTKDPFGRLVAVGSTTLLAVQTFTNLCMTLGVGPITGVTLPFLSQGGSSLVSSFACIGLLVSVAYHRPIIMANDAFRFDEEAGQ